MSHTFTVQINLEDDLVAHVEISYTPGLDATRDDPGCASEWDIQKILVTSDGTLALNMTETLLELDFEVMYEDKIQEAADLAWSEGICEPDPDYLRDAARDDKLTGDA